jgi:hypothetical protein
MKEEDRFDELMRDAERTYRNPPKPDFDAMWTSIEREAFGGTTQQRSPNGAERPTFRLVTNRWVGIAATLVIGIGIGRASSTLNRPATSNVNVLPTVAAVTPVRPDSAIARPYELETSQYLGQTAALLVSLPSEIKAGRTSAQFTTRAGDLLSRTRLLMDSPAAIDPAMRGLLEDLELVLVQVVRLQDGTDLDLINRALEQRELIPRLRTAAADISAN